MASRYRCLLLIVIFFTCLTVAVRADRTGAVPEYVVVRSSESLTELSVRIPDVEITEIHEGGRTFQAVRIPGAGWSMDAGRPELPALARFLVVPPGASVAVQHIDVDEEILKGMELLPHQEEHGRGTGKPVLTLDREFYQSDAFSPEEVVEVGPVVHIRDVSLVSLILRPIQYNPVKGEVRLCRHLRVVLSHQGGRAADSRLGGIEGFQRLLEATVINPALLPSPGEAGRGAYLIITPDRWADIIQPLARWKRRKGHPTEVVALSQIGPSPTSDQIRNYIQSYYDTAPVPLEYVLLVGDSDWLPTFFYEDAVEDIGRDAADHPYSMLAGEDYLPDVFVGRLPISSDNHLRTVVSKIISYESDPYLGDPDWFRRALMVCNYGGNASARTTKLWIREKLLDHGFSRVDTSFSFDSDECNVDLIESAINSGVSFVNYRGWMDWGGWASSENVRNILGLQNGYMLPVVTDMVCGAAAFYGDCPAEAWLRAGTVLNPRGGIAVIGPTAMNTKVYFNNVLDCGFYAGVFDDSLRTVGQALARAKLELYMQYPLNRGPGHAWNSVECYFYMYTLIGDPGLEMWTDAPQHLTVEHLSAIVAGSGIFSCTVGDADRHPLKGAYVCLTRGGQILSGGFSGEEGEIRLPLGVEAGDSLELTVTGHNRKPYQAVLVAEDPLVCVALAGDAIADDSLGESRGDGDGIINPGERIALALALRNTGTAGVAPAVSVTIHSDDPYISVLTDSVAFGDLAPAQVAWGRGNCLLQVSANCPDRRTLHLLLDIADGQGLCWEDQLLLEVEAPDYTLRGIHIDDGLGGNADGRIDPGETVAVTLTLANEGSKRADGVRARLTTDDPRITLINSTADLGTIPPGGQIQQSGEPFLLSAAFTTFNGYRIHLTLELESRGGMIDTVDLTLPVGTASEADPVGPDRYGYYAFDSGDQRYYERPTFDWIEIDPRLGGPGKAVTLNDEPYEEGYEQGSTQVVPLPFPFRYYGSSYEQISVCSNGWLAMGTTWLSNFRNWSIPSVMNPPGLVAPFGDDLYIGGGRVATWHDEHGHRFIVEWSRVHNVSNAATETFEVIFYDPRYRPTVTGDGEIVFQYQAVANVDNSWNFATVGIQSPDQSDGIEYTYAGQYPPGAQPLAPGLAIRFTTGEYPPENAFLLLYSVLIDDDDAGSSEGDGDGLVDAGERIELALQLINYGLQRADEVAAVLRSSDPEVLIEDSLAIFPDIPPGGMGVNGLPFVMAIDPECEDGRVVQVTAEINIGGSLRSEIHFQLEVNAPALVYDSHCIRTVLGDGDERAEAGETCQLLVTLGNMGGGEATMIKGSLRTGDGSVTILEAAASFPDVRSGELSTNQADPFLFRVSDEASFHHVPFVLSVLSNSGHHQADIPFVVKVGRADVLLVDDDGGENLETYYLEALSVQSRSHEHYDIEAERRLDPLMFEEHRAIIWFTGSQRDSTLTPADQERLRDFLEGGGSLFLSGQDIGYDLVENGSEEDAAFYADCLHADYVRDGGSCDILMGVSGEPLIDEVSQANILSLVLGGAANQSSPSVILPRDGAGPVYRYSYTHDVAGIKYDGLYRLVYFAFGFESIGSYTGANHAAKRSRLMRNIVNWFQYERIKGDLDKDGLVTILDVVRMVAVVLKAEPPASRYELWAADCNDDGCCDARDIVVAVRTILGYAAGGGLDFTGGAP